jgi:hypothetical protein
MKSCFKIDYVTDHEDRIYVNRSGNGEVFLTKHPRDILVIRPFLYVMPSLYVIYMIRDPRDMVVSVHGSRPDEFWCSLRFWKEFNKYYREVSDHPRVMTVRYEDLVSDPDGVQEKLQDKMPFLAMKKKFSSYHENITVSGESLEALRGIRPISRASIGRWRDYLPRISRQLELHGDISDELIKFGYEKDKDWLHLLDNIKSDRSTSYLPEYFTREELKKLKSGKYRHALRYYLSQRGLGLHRLARYL